MMCLRHGYIFVLQRETLKLLITNSEKMYIHLGNNQMLRTDEIIGIFDLDTATVSKRTRNFLNKAEKKGEVTYTGYELPKSFIVTAKNKGENKVYLSQLSTSTLLKRSENIE